MADDVTDRVADFRAKRAEHMAQLDPERARIQAAARKQRRADRVEALVRGAWLAVVDVETWRRTLRIFAAVVTYQEFQSVAAACVVVATLETIAGINRQQ